MPRETAQPTPPTTVTIYADTIELNLSDLSVTEAAVFLDGVMLGVAPCESDSVCGRRATFSLPGHVLAGALDVFAFDTGCSLLGAPLDVAAERALTWNGVSVAGAELIGRFTVQPGAPGAVIPVELTAGPRLLARAFARADEAGFHRFVAPLLALPALGEALETGLRVGGRALPGVALDAVTCGIVGYVDSVGIPFVKGWAIDLADPARRVTVTLLVDGQPAATAIADRTRNDVQAMGLGDGRCGFELTLPRGLALDRSHPVAVVLAGTPTHLVNSPATLPPAPPTLGYFDAVDGPFAGGWLVNMHAPDSPLTVEAVCDGAVIGSAAASLFRGDVEQAGLPTAQCGFRVMLDRPLAELFDRDIVLRVAGTGEVVPGSPRQIGQNPNITRHLTRAADIPPDRLQRLARRMTHRTRALCISIVMPVYDTPQDWLVQALDSVRGQWSANWELICIDDASTRPYIRAVLDDYAARDRRIRVLRAPRNGGIARAVNFGLRAARGDYVAFLDHDDVLEPDAVFRLAEAALGTGAALIYGDEALTTADIGSVVEVRARPAFSHDYYLSHPYFVHPVCVQTALARRLAGWDESLPASADVDFVLRVIEAAESVAHVPAVLYRWRTHAGSAGHAQQAAVMAATKAALSRHLARLGHDATVADGLGFNEYRIDWPDDGGEVLVVIPTKDRADLLRACIDSIGRTSPGEHLRIVVIDHQSTETETVRYLADIAGRHTVMPYEGPFNYARMNNEAVRLHGGRARYVLFLNNDVEAREPGWIPRLRSLAAREAVGAVGPLLLYGDGRVQHAGVLMGFSGAAEHAMKLFAAYGEGGRRHSGYNCNLTSVRDYAAVTAACLMLRRDVFTSVGGFDEAFAVGFNDTDLCLRIGEAGYKVLYDGHTTLYHHESATRRGGSDHAHPKDDARLRERWARFFAEGDRFYSPLLAPDGIDHVLRRDGGCKGRVAKRLVHRADLSGTKQTRVAEATMRTTRTDKQPLQ